MNKNTTNNTLKEELYILINKKFVLDHSGSLNTSLAVKSLKEEGFDVIAVCIDQGMEKIYRKLSEGNSSWGSE